MNPIQKEYEAEQEVKAIYRKNGADFHTLEYVRWLESYVAILLERRKLINQSRGKRKPNKLSDD